MEAVSAKIVAIRTAAGWDGVTCGTCGRLVTSPYRRHDDSGKVIEGCVDASHTGHLVTVGESMRWHHRDEAVAIRRRELQSLKAAR